MKNMNEIENEKRLTKMFKPNAYFSLACNENCPSWNDDDCHCDLVLANRLAKYEDICRDIFNLSDDEVIPVGVLEESLKIAVVFTIVSEHNIAAKLVYDSVLATIHDLYGKKAGEKDDNV